MAGMDNNILSRLHALKTIACRENPVWGETDEFGSFAQTYGRYSILKSILVANILLSTVFTVWTNLSTCSLSFGCKAEDVITWT